MKKTKSTYYSLRSFAVFLQGYKKSIAITFLVFLASDVAIAVVPLLVGRLTSAATHGDASTIWLYAWLLVAASSSHDLLWRVSELTHRNYINPLRFVYENHMFQYVIHRPYPYFVDKFSGKLSSNISLIYRELQGLLTDIFYSYATQLIGIVTMALILASVNWQTFAIFIGGITGMILVGRFTLQKSTRSEAIGTDAESTKSGIVIDSLANFVSVKSFQKEAAEIAAMRKAQQRTLETSQTAYNWAIVFWASMSLFVRHLIWPLAIILNVYLFSQGQLDIGQLATLLSAILLFSSTVWDSIWQASQLGLRFARIEEAHRYVFGKTVFNTRTTENAVHPPLTFAQQLQLHNLTFAYPDQPDVPVLKNINLAIQKGEKIGIVGRSGSGKTTLVKLLLDFYELPECSLLADNTPVSSRQVASSITYVPQDTSLFHRSIADNIAYAAAGSVSREQIIAAAKQAHAHDFIMEIEGNYDAMVGERGVKLSGGQRQRIAIARAMLKNSPILVLDEATSALDSESEMHIQEALAQLMQHRTTIVIAHRLSTIQKMDRIIVLDKGMIVEDGTHHELLAQKHLYAALWAHQSGGFIEE